MKKFAWVMIFIMVVSILSGTIFIPAFAATKAKMTCEPGFFKEAPINDGSIGSTKTIVLEGISFKDGEFSDADYSSNCSSILTGLTLKLTRDSEYQARIKLEGNAASHSAINSKTNLSISFKNSAFKNYTGNVTQLSMNNLKVDFIDVKPIRILEVYPSTIKDGTFSNGSYSGIKYQGDYSSDVSNALRGLSGYEITSMSLNKFISLIEDVNGNYDIVYFGRGTYFKNAVDLKRYGNDITDKRAAEVLRFINSGQLCIFHPDAFMTDQIDKKDTKMHTNFSKVSRKSVIKLTAGTTDPNVSSQLKTAILNYISATSTDINRRPILSVYQKPLSYDNMTNPLESRYIGFDFKVYDKEDTTVKAKLFIDRNNDSLFKEEELVEEKDVNSNNAASILYKMPDGLTGIFFWKLEIVDTDGAKDELVDVFRLMGKEINVDVLQITPNSMSENGSLTEMFNRSFAGETGNKLGYRKGEYKINVVEATLDEFNTGANNPKHLGSDLNSYYDMIVIGFQDSYGQNVFNKNALDRIDKFIKTNQGVMFTHDTIWDRDKTSLSTQLMDETAQTSAYNAGLVTYPSRKDNSAYSNYFNEVGGYAKVNSDYKLDEFQNVSPNTPATLIKKVNSSAISLYPFNLESTGQSDMVVAKTHFQWHKLDLEQPDVIPLFNMYKESNSERVNDDAMNGFYTYSNGNITYSGTGHDTENAEYPDYEVKLFVNTMMKAYSSQNHKPEIDVTSPDDQANVSAGETHQDVKFRAYDFDLGDDILDYKVYIDRGAGYVEAASGAMNNGETISKSIEKKFNTARTFKIKISVQDRGKNGVYTPAGNYTELTLNNVVIDSADIKPSISISNYKLLVGETLNLSVLAKCEGFANPPVTITPKLSMVIPQGMSYNGNKDCITINTTARAFTFNSLGAAPTSAAIANYSIGTNQLYQDANEKSFTFDSSLDMQNGTPANTDTDSVTVRSASIKVEVKDDFGSGNYLRDYSLSGVEGARVKKVGGTYEYMDLQGGKDKEFVLAVPTGYSLVKLELFRNESVNPDGEDWVPYNDGISDDQNKVKINIDYENYRWKIVYHLKLNLNNIPVSYYKVITPVNDVDFIGTDEGNLTANPIYQLPAKRGSKVLLAAMFEIIPIEGANVTDLKIGVETKDQAGTVIPTSSGLSAIIIDTDISFAKTTDTNPFSGAERLKSDPAAKTAGTYAGGTYYVLIEIPKAENQKVRISSLTLVMDNGSTPTFYTSEIGLITIMDFDIPPLR